ncbi:MAG: TraR/DksA C4-type zinc finger protein [Planctomycetes bacterium]|nr:TraR/DksA C4-type zinc finger protein [Planctomycetota bacterium]
MNKKDREEFKRLLLRRRAQLSGEVEKLAEETLRHNRQDAAGDLSSMPIHMADIASDNFEKELNLDFIQMESAEVRDMDEALARIEQGTFGTCESCDKPIPKARLRAVPHARLCIGCKREEEGQG